MRLRFVAIDEDRPGARWAVRFREVFPRFRGWLAGQADPPSPAACARALARHMPELVPLYRTLCGLAGDDPLAHRLLTQWCPPPLPLGCSVAVETQGEPLLVRNYDFTPDFFEGTVLRGRWSGHGVIAMVEAAWGTLDGVNEAGLAIAITYGGRPVLGEGFAIPLVARYVLETCGTCAERWRRFAGFP
ncbi:carcinine hydrolase/isopenicillin-N N-acyltransferase family protein [Arenibaculum pallidiluteum]|uniref:carcinine hydrolase/isopenicillin-N N-acyltransferase family protein n=1 Tax=Arenibaculum pallidiluteum TaxID=2812559 RepID=UPI001A974811|nr:carcinine hydrolase/isopenicillin-N N-acyltransferase family protein [Arenibaculum pallidiluteum]